jgi:hypothetical protein
MTAVQQYWLLPPPPYKLVSDLYPYYLKEETELAGDWIGGLWFSMFGPEGTDLNADFTLGNLQNTVQYLTYTIPWEGADLSADFTSGNLVTTVAYKTYTIPWEGADLSADFTLGVLTVTVAYASYTIPYEAADLSADFTAGVLI